MIVTLLKRYESGGLTRRELVQGLMMVATGAATASRAEAQSGMKFDWAPLVDHIQVNASDVRKSTEFYQKALGLDLLRVGPPNDRNCCPDTSAFFGVGKRLILAVRANKPAGLTHHWALLMNGFDREAVTRELKARGVEPRMNPESGFHVVDPDGVEIQLMGQPGPA
jgi:catechol 2,3-dioxygenase-like lactoylglutathione lyase family enzyme